MGLGRPTAPRPFVGEGLAGVTAPGCDGCSRPREEGAVGRVPKRGRGGAGAAPAPVASGRSLPGSPEAEGLPLYLKLDPHFGRKRLLAENTKRGGGVRLCVNTPTSRDQHPPLQAGWGTGLTERGAGAPGTILCPQLCSLPSGLPRAFAYSLPAASSPARGLVPGLKAPEWTWVSVRSTGKCRPASWERPAGCCSPQ